MCYLPSSQALFAGQPLLVVACSRKQNSSQGQVAFEFAHDRAIDISQDVSCFELRTVMRLINLIAGFGFWFVSLFSPVAVVGVGEEVSTHMSPYHTWSSLPLPTLDLPRLEAERLSAYIDNAEPVCLLKDSKPCSVESREPWPASEQGSHLVGTASVAVCGSLSSS